MLVVLHMFGARRWSFELKTLKLHLHFTHDASWGRPFWVDLGSGFSLRYILVWKINPPDKIRPQVQLHDPHSIIFRWIFKLWTLNLSPRPKFFCVVIRPQGEGFRFEGAAKAFLWASLPRASHVRISKTPTQCTVVSSESPLRYSMLQ